ncbi:hypothetical protein QYF36_025085 [Acer negundo]|nr:hypothetical protein QYF36_025085 [Acer negundo]
MFNGNSPDSGTSSQDLMGLFKGLGREDILEVLSQGVCLHCQPLLETRILNLVNKKLNDSSLSNDNIESMNKTPRLQETMLPTSLQTQEALHSVRRKCYASPASVSGRQHPDSEILLNDGLSGGSSEGDGGLSEEQKERIRFSQVVRDKDFVHVERIDGRAKNVIQGLELHTKVFNAEEQKRIVEYVYNLQHKGRKGQLRERTYSEPRKWMRGKGRVTIQCGCSYNYATDKNGNPPGIIRDEDVDPLPPLFKLMIKRLVRWHVLQPTCIPNSCIVNIYDEGDCIPPHIDHHDFLRPFCTVSFLTECNILFGSNLKVLSPGEFSGPVSIPLPVGSVLILNGNGADIAKHCVPAVPAKRISITFRKMDDSKLPYEFSPDPELMGIKPMVYSPLNKSQIQQNGHLGYSPCANSSFQQNGTLKKSNGNSFTVDNDDFPPLGSNHGRFSRRESKQ